MTAQPNAADIRAKIAELVEAGDPVMVRCADQLYAILDDVDERARS